jgi:hypothetical protein
MYLGFFLVLAALAPQAAPNPDKGSAVSGISGSEVYWAGSFEEAAALARKMPNGRVLIEFVEPACGECVYVNKLVVPATSFHTFTRDKVPVQIDRSTEEGRRLADRLGVYAVPAWVVVTPDLLVSGLQIGRTNQGGWFETFFHSEQSWVKYRKKLDQEKQTPGDEDLVFDIAQETFKRGGDEQAEPRFRELVAKAKKPAIKEQSLAYLASIELEDGRVDEAARTLDQLLKITTDPALKERAELRRADVEIARGRKDLAASRLAAFKREHPSSRLVKDADALLEALRAQGFGVN